MNRAIAPGVLNNDFFHFQTLQHVMRMTRTWDATMSMIPRGGDTIWGGLDWSPEEDYNPNKRKHNPNGTESSGNTNDESQDTNKMTTNYGRMISFGKDVADASLSELNRIEFRVRNFSFNFNIIAGMFIPAYFMVFSTKINQNKLKSTKIN